MPKISFDFFTLLLFSLLTLSIYSIIIAVFINAKRKYKGGIVGRVIQFIIVTIAFFLLADVALILIPQLGFQTGYTIHVILKISAITCLAIGGLKFFVK